MPGSVTRALIPKTPPQRRNPSLPRRGCARGFTQAALISGQPSTGYPLRVRGLGWIKGGGN